jgi:hypothetical protein
LVCGWGACGPQGFPDDCVGYIYSSMKSVRFEMSEAIYRWVGEGRGEELDGGDVMVGGSGSEAPVAPCWQALAGSHSVQASGQAAVQGSTKTGGGARPLLQLLPCCSCCTSPVVAVALLQLLHFSCCSCCTGARPTQEEMVTLQGWLLEQGSATSSGKSRSFVGRSLVDAAETITTDA